MLIRRLVDEHFRGFYPWCTIRALEEFVIVAVGYLRLAVEAIGAAVVGIGAASTVYRYVLSLLGLRKYSNAEIRLYFGQYLVLGLEFQLGADILATAVSPTSADVLAAGGELGDLRRHRAGHARDPSSRTRSSHTPANSRAHGPGPGVLRR